MKSHLAALLILTACDLGNGTGADTPEPVWALTLEASHTRAQAGEEVSVTWGYTTDDEVVYEELCLIYLHFELVPECYDVTTLDGAASWTHEVPVAVWLTSTNTDGEQTTASLQILNEQDAWLSADITHNSPGYPVLGSSSEIEFSQFIAIYDDDGDNRIDGLTRLYGDSNDAPFRAWTDSIDQQSNGMFSFTQGPMFPPASWLDPTFGYSNLLVFGGAIAITGEEVLPYKAADGTTGTYTRGSELYFDPIFIQMSYLYGEASGILTATDIQLGSLTQGLIVGITSTDQLGSFGEPHDHVLTPVNDTTWSSGAIKGAEVGHSITLLSDDFIQASVSLDTVSWNMPVLRDEVAGDQMMFTLRSTP